MTETRCKARTRLGAPCSARATPSGFCSIHSDPKRAAELGRLSGESRNTPAVTGLLVLRPPKTACDLHQALGRFSLRSVRGEWTSVWAGALVTLAPCSSTR